MLSKLLRLTRRYRRNCIRILLVYSALFLIVDTFRLVSFGTAPQRVSPSSRPASDERIFIASIHWNNEAILRSHWNKAVIDLVQYFGPMNVFVAVLESGSWDDSKGALRNLDTQLAQLGVAHSVVLENTTHKDEMDRVPSPGGEGWILTPRGKTELRRIPYLAKLRNRVMAEMTRILEDNPKQFTKVLWLNDVVFTGKQTEDVLTLLYTNSGHYAAACSLDFSKPPLYYDTFALRDISGTKPITQTWPFFLSSASRRALISNNAVPVQSCWNGMVAMEARSFYGQRPLEFRGISDRLADLHLEGSECCLVHADNPLSASKGVWLNPNVRVGYNPDAYEAVNLSLPQAWPSPWDRIIGMWYNRWMRLVGMPRRTVENFVVKSRLRRWKTQKSVSGEQKVEHGVYCLINEMQVLVENGWKHL